MTQPVVTLADAYARELQRVTELIPLYRDLGAVGVFGLTMLRDLVARAHRAALEGDVIEMLRIYEELKDCK